MTTDRRPVALVTGGGRRIGAAIARRLHDHGYNLAIHYGNSRTEAEALAAELNARVPISASTFQADLRQLSAVAALADNVLGHWGHLDTLVNNASTFYPTALGDTGEADWNELMDSNLKGPYFLATHLADPLRRRGGTVVNIADIHAWQPLKGYPIYSMAKAGVAMMTKALARELAPLVRVNGVAPGSILWPEGKAGMSESAKARLLETIPLGRLGTPDHIAHLVCLLARTPGYMTGQVIAVDGGLHLTGG